MASTSTSAHSAFWQQQFPEGINLVPLQLDRARLPASSYLRDSVTVNFAVNAWPSLVLAAVETVLFRNTGQEVIIVGVHTPETKALLPIRSHWSDESKVTMPELSALRAAALRESAVHSAFPLRELQMRFGAVDQAFGRRLFNIALVWSECRDKDQSMQNADSEEFLAQCDVVFVAASTVQGLAITGDFDADILDAESVVRLIEQFGTLLASAAAEPETAVLLLPILTASERQRLLVEFNSTEREFLGNQSLIGLFEAQVALSPDATALTSETGSLSYRRLDERGNQLAHCLIKKGVGPEILVGICMERSFEMVIGLLGVLKAGGAYVPIDPAYPRDRLAYMLEDSGVAVLLVQEHLRNALPPHRAETISLDSCWHTIAAEDRSRPSSRATMDHLAYMIYTSGSTGRPKGTLNTHRGIVNRLLWMQEQYRLTATDSVLQKTPFSFDVSVWEFFWPLLAGARLVLARPDGHRDPDYLTEVIAGERITVMHFVPSMLRVFLDAGGLHRCDSLREVICSGESLSPDLVALFHTRLGANLHNLYGPTEAAVDVTHWPAPRGVVLDLVPIGRPIANTRCYILDAHLQPVPVGVAGELHIGGVQVGRGYHRRPELTGEKFIADLFHPDPNARLYKTGDLCRYQSDGNIEYLGRIDNQVKIRGFRVELAEIESVLMQHGTIKDVVVAAREESAGEKRLVAYVVMRQGVLADQDSWRRHLKETLPDFMVPAYYVVLDEFPLSPNGKVDRKALPPPAASPSREVAESQAPANELEQRIARVWCEVLGVSSLGRQTNFFDAGGDSLRLVRVRQRLRDDLGIDISVVDMFQHPTIATLAKCAVGNAKADDVVAGDLTVRVRAQRQRDAARSTHRRALKNFNR